MTAIHFTKAQRAAVEVTGQSVLVSAAAGSGKTAVLAERCAYLVCDAPAGARCDVTELLVLTFTEAAAAEMRARIIEAIRQRAAARPKDARLRRQAALCEAAHISTIHAFCLWLVRRWFTHLDLDPSLTVLDGDEERLLQREVVEDLFGELYASLNESADDRQGGRHAAGGDDGLALGRRFERLVNNYGLGSDREVAAFVLRLSEFLGSLPEPKGWMRDATSSLQDGPEEVVARLSDSLRAEVDRQIEFCDQAAARIETGDAAGQAYGDQIRDYVRHLRKCVAAHRPEPDGFEALRQQLGEFSFPRPGGPRLGKDADPARVAARDAARALREEVKTRLFEQRLKKRFCLFSRDEWIDGLRQTAPYVATLTELSELFRARYDARKRRLGVLDFADLERLAFTLLHSAEDSASSSEVARSLHRRFKHVLVDEFQDINPIQEAILRFASHESDPNKPGNLFVVGDVKQSIYRFRLAEPRMFLDREARFSGGGSGRSGCTVLLQENFRSRSSILDAVNLVFSRVMRGELGSADVLYDESAFLRPGGTDEAAERGAPVELHLLERGRGVAGDGDSGADRDDSDDSPSEPEAEERGVAKWDDPSRWEAIDREAYLIGTTIRAWRERGEAVVDGRPPEFRDIAILLRATKVNAERMAAMLNAMDIPAYADVGGSLFGVREVRDVLAALQVMDNVQQDIPLAAVLRSGILGGPLSVDELVEVRSLDRAIPFHAAVRAYRQRGGEERVRQRLEAIMSRVDRYRQAARRRPLAEVLWQLYQDQAYLAYASGLPNGAQRRANLLKLHELARRFGTFRRQGLHRFLGFVKSLEDEGEQIGSAPALGEAADVVRIMSIHRAKGLEFPVVFVAGLGSQFNLGDRSGRMIFEREAKVGLKVVDSERLIEFPSAAHRLVADEIEQNTRAEELRILYVAMTRAQERLVLVGTSNDVERVEKVDPSSAGRSPATLTLATARRPLDWLIAALAAAPEGIVRRPGEGVSDGQLVAVHTHRLSEMLRWQVQAPTDPGEAAAREAIAQCAALPPDEPADDQDVEVERVRSRIEYDYPFAAMTSLEATLAASEFKGAYDYTSTEWERRDTRAMKEDFTVPPSRYALTAGDRATRRGLAVHRLMQHLDFAAARSSGVASELQRIVAAGVLTEEESALVDPAAVEWFVRSPLGEAICEAGDGYRREFAFIAGESPTLVDPMVAAGEGDFVLVRGIVDGILPTAGGLELVDFKTDAVSETEVNARAERYRPQVMLYARALARLYGRAVRRAWLVFLHCRRLHGFENPGEDGRPASLG